MLQQQKLHVPKNEGYAWSTMMCSLKNGTPAAEEHHKPHVAFGAGITSIDMLR